MVSIVKTGKINICKMTLGSMQTNTYIVYGNDKRGIIIDPASNADIIKIKVTELGINVEAVLLTHGHFDHIGAADEIRKIYGIDIYAMEDEKEILESAENNLSQYFGNPFTVKADKYFNDNDETEIAGLEIKVIATPGHTIGGACYLISKDSEKVLISGDTLFRESHGRYDFPTGSYRQLMESITKKLLILDEDLQVFPGHNEDTTIGEEKSAYRI